MISRFTYHQSQRRYWDRKNKRAATMKDLLEAFFEGELQVVRHLTYQNLRADMTVEVKKRLLLWLVENYIATLSNAKIDGWIRRMGTKI